MAKLSQVKISSQEHTLAITFIHDHRDDATIARPCSSAACRSPAASAA